MNKTLSRTYGARIWAIGGVEPVSPTAWPRTIVWTTQHRKTVLVEVYRSEADTAEHKKTAHYATWRDAVVDMMAEDRYSVKYENVFPDEAGW